jgi:hypothetical protein
MSRSTKLEDVEEEIQQMNASMDQEEMQDFQETKEEETERILSRLSPDDKSMFDEFKDFFMDNMLEILIVVLLVLMSNSLYMSNLLEKMNIENQYISMGVKGSFVGLLYFVTKYHVLK